MGDGGKGSRARPFSVDRATYSSNWDRIFRKDFTPAQEKPVEGDLTVDNEGRLQEYSEGYWSQVENKG